MVRVNFVEIDLSGKPVGFLGVCAMPQTPREKEILRFHQSHDQPFLVTHVAYHVAPTGVVLTNREGQSVPELGYDSCEVRVRRMEAKA